jgi:MutS domain I
LPEAGMSWARCAHASRRAGRRSPSVTRGPPEHRLAFCRASPQHRRAMMCSPRAAADAAALAAPLGVDAERFAARGCEAKFAEILAPGAIRDGCRRRPEHPDYDPRTLHIPDGWFKKHNVSAGQRQWWEFKAKNFDSVMLFKMGKFYEMFEMDAHVGAEVLGLSYMKVRGCLSVLHVRAGGSFRSKGQRAFCRGRGAGL